jgi:hypothetical protein
MARASRFSAASSFAQQHLPQPAIDGRIEKCRELTVSNDILVPISIAELIDKITILEIKMDNISDKAKLSNINNELNRLKKIAGSLPISNDNKISSLQGRLKAVNKDIWDAEDKIRDLDRKRDFGQTYVDVARSIYRLNDARADAKKEINILSGSDIIEEKGYSPY